MITDGGAAVTCRDDVSGQADVDDMFAVAVKLYGGVDILHDNAAGTDLAHQDGAVADLGDEVWDATVQVALRGAFLCSGAAI